MISRSAENDGEQESPEWLQLGAVPSCSADSALSEVWTVVCLVLPSQSYIAFLAVWLLRSHCGGGSLQPFTKVLTALLSFKLLNVYSAYAKVSLCGSGSTALSLLAVINSASRAMYESMLYGVLVLLSCGLFLVCNSLRRSRVSYLSFLVSVIYMVISAKNMLRVKSTALSLTVFLVVWGNSAFFSTLTLIRLRSFLRETEFLHTARYRISLLVKKRSFQWFVAVTQCYFVGEGLFHGLLTPLTQSIPALERVALLHSVHEAMEYLTLACVYYLYQAVIQEPTDAVLSDVSTSFAECPVFIAQKTVSGRDREALEDVNWDRPILIRNPGAGLTLAFIEPRPAPCSPRSDY